MRISRFYTFKVTQLRVRLDFTHSLDEKSFYTFKFLSQTFGFRKFRATCCNKYSFTDRHQLPGLLFACWVGFEFLLLCFFFQKKKKKSENKCFQHVKSIKQFGSTSGLTFHQPWCGSKLFAEVIMRQQRYRVNYQVLTEMLLWYAHLITFSLSF